MTRIIKRLTIIALLVTFLSFIMITNARAILTPGVAPGLVFEYDVTALWSSTDEYASIPQNLMDVNQTKTFEVRIHEVNGANVSTFIAVYYRNGSSPYAEYGYVNVDTGEAYGSFAAIIAGDLNAYDVIHPLGTDAITINETVIKTYESGNRETNRIIIETTNATTGVTARVDRYFDKVTGILVEEHETTSNQETTTTITWKIKSSNAWVIPEFPSVLVLPLVMAITMIAVIAYKKKHLDMAKTLSPS